MRYLIGVGGKKGYVNKCHKKSDHGLYIFFLMKEY